jgi:hypothetical protein
MRQLGENEMTPNCRMPQNVRLSEWLGRAAAALTYTGWAVNLTPRARATFITVSKRGFAPGASAL